jgi:hypothetical protein
MLLAQRLTKLSSLDQQLLGLQKDLHDESKAVMGRTLAIVQAALLTNSKCYLLLFKELSQHLIIADWCFLTLIIRLLPLA